MRLPAKGEEKHSFLPSPSALPISARQCDWSVCPLPIQTTVVPTPSSPDESVLLFECSKFNDSVSYTTRTSWQQFSC